MAERQIPGQIGDATNTSSKESVECAGKVRRFAQQSAKLGPRQSIEHSALQRLGTRKVVTAVQEGDLTEGIATPQEMEDLLASFAGRLEAFEGAGGDDVDGLD